MRAAGVGVLVVGALVVTAPAARSQPAAEKRAAASRELTSARSRPPRGSGATSTSRTRTAGAARPRRPEGVCHAAGDRNVHGHWSSDRLGDEQDGRPPDHDRDRRAPAQPPWPTSRRREGALVDARLANAHQLA
jgi:hypothetical protein